MPDPAERSVIGWLAVALTAASFVLLWPFLPWILFAIWAGALARPLHAWLGNHLGQRPRLAALITTVGLVLLVAPMIVFLASLTDDAVAVARRAVATDRVQNLLHTLGPRNGNDTGPSDLTGLVVSQGGRAWTLAQQIAGTAARVLIGLAIAIGGLYSVLVDGGRWYAWLESHAPISTASFRRLAGALVETGRGLFFGILGAGLAQAVVATVLYVALGVPQPFALGVLTLACSVIPAVGTSIVWLPISIALALSGHDAAALVLLASGFLVIGTIDNFVRPYLARRGSLQLPAFIVALAMFGGIATMGARGVILGPLILRLAKEVLSILRKRDSASP
ncbi:MAG TPA: AI-2E family transporter [Kofleriaceae bacterium]|nr:AI-2E family transporter [Kofleriaceae bacterium]